ncbi:hypothetical protein S40285_10174 [Stachybotrys chlorohalonatus IBT 40285]|uniref:Uncharacterized protein n=1 Tax=Stachybotrys chlorohalonatus (strain IBT 40285) TaxID=1283841 RepID=A0A084QVC8_STAC4|nr:hypothetical protein S40285_10174 [Stachybotrys chlorohalonata IBT 40285]
MFEILPSTQSRVPSKIARLPYMAPVDRLQMLGRRSPVCQVDASGGIRLDPPCLPGDTWFDLRLLLPGVVEAVHLEPQSRGNQAIEAVGRAKAKVAHASQCEKPSCPLKSRGGQAGPDLGFMGQMEGIFRTLFANSNRAVTVSDETWAGGQGRQGNRDGRDWMQEIRPVVQRTAQAAGNRMRLGRAPCSVFCRRRPAPKYPRAKGTWSYVNEAIPPCHFGHLTRVMGKVATTRTADQRRTGGLPASVTIWRAPPTIEPWFTLGPRALIPSAPPPRAHLILPAGAQIKMGQDERDGVRWAQWFPSGSWSNSPPHLLKCIWLGCPVISCSPAGSR